MQQNAGLACLTNLTQTVMEHHPEVPPYLGKVINLNQAIFYCFNETNEKLPVSICTDFVFSGNDVLRFSTQHLPLTEQPWNIYAAELYFFRKGLPYSVILDGVAVIGNGLPAMVEFRIQSASCFDMPKAYTEKGFLQLLFRPTMQLYKKSTELLHVAFGKKTGAIGIH